MDAEKIPSTNVNSFLRQRVNTHGSSRRLLHTALQWLKPARETTASSLQENASSVGMQRDSNQAFRGDRLNPGPFHSRYFVLSALRDEMSQVVARHLPPGPLAVLDFGCGNMPYRPLFEARGTIAQYVGADRPGNDLAAVEIDDAGRVEAPDGSFDVVLSSQVLEHVLSPPDYLLEARRLLRTGGHLILATHGYWKYHPDPTDYWRWTGDGLRKIIQEAGFRLKRFTGLGNLASAGMQLLQDATFWKLPRSLRAVYAFLMQRAMWVACKVGGHSDHDALVFVVTAEKL